MKNSFIYYLSSKTFFKTEMIFIIVYRSVFFNISNHRD